MEDRAQLDAAFKGVYGVFSVQNFWLPNVGFEGEIRQGKNVADAAKAAGVQHLVYSSVGAAHRGMGQKHFESKWIIEQYIHSLDIPYTILRPAAFFENFNWERASHSQWHIQCNRITSREGTSIDRGGRYCCICCIGICRSETIPWQDD